MVNKEHYDACIVGCGIIGSTIALSIANNENRVLAVEHGALPLRGSSLAGFGALTPYSDPFFIGETALFAAKSLELYKSSWLPELFSITNRSVPLSDSGLLQIVSTKEKLDAEIQRYEEDCIPGYRPSIINKASLEHTEPAITQDCAGALFHPEPWIDLGLYMGALEVAVSRSSFIELQLNSTVRDLEISNQGVIGTTSDGSHFSSDYLIVCTGLNGFERPNLRSFAMRWVRGDGIAVRSPNNSPLFTHNIYSGSGFISPRGTGEMLLGSTYVDEGVKPEGTPMPDRDTISFESLERITSACANISNSLKDCSIERIWRGWRPASEDDYPIFGPDPVHSNVVYAQGFLGLGITLSVAVGNSVSAYVSGEAPDFPKEMRPERFDAQ